MLSAHSFFILKKKKKKWIDKLDGMVDDTSKS